MATTVTEVYSELRDAGASEEKARAAAVAMAMHEPRFALVDGRIILKLTGVSFIHHEGLGRLIPPPLTNSKSLT